MSVHIDPTFEAGVAGRTIKSIVKADVDGDVWPGLMLDDGSIIVIQADAEGNGGGFMSLNKGAEIIGSAGYVGEGP